MAMQLTLPDGRNLDYFVTGAKGGLPLVWLHGTPGAYPVMPSLAVACESKGLALITMSRAGYGGSTRHEGRRVVDDVADVQALLDHLGHERCFVAGWSGGGPHALACASRLRGCLAVVSIASVGPHGAEGLDFIAGQGEDNVQEFAAALKGEPELQAFCKPARAEMIEADVAGMIELMSSNVPDVDRRALLESDDLGDSLIVEIREGLKHGSDGWVDDDMAFLAPWGFDFSEIKCPVFLYQASEDKMVPYAHGVWLSKQIPEKYLTKYLEQGQGHISICLGRVNGILEGLLSITL